MQELGNQWINNRSVNEYDKKWNIYYDALVCYGEQYGTCDLAWNVKCKLPDRLVVGLGHWLGSQKSGKRNRSLKIYRFSQLQKLVDQELLDWNMTITQFTTKGYDWNFMYDLLVHYGEEHGGDCNVPQGYATTMPDEFEVGLGMWLDNQRSFFNEDKLPYHQVSLLQLLVDSGQLSWRRGYK